MRPKVILVEGLPGFGKSTTAQLVYEILVEHKVEAHLFVEGNLEHPADYDGVACFEEAEYEQFLHSYAKYNELISNFTRTYEGHYLLEYRKMSNEQNTELPWELLDIASRKDMYELPLADNRQWIIAKWRQFAQQASRENVTYIFECAFIQNPVTVGMIKYDAPEQEVASYVAELAMQVEELNPLLIYVQQQHLEQAFRKVVQERPKEWSEGFMEYYTTQGFGKNRGYSGLEGTLQVLKHRLELEQRIYESLDLAKIKVDNSAYDRKHYKDVLTGLLSAYLHK
ncbi:hypothetical protein [Paenibacillus donghaensis]|uniref:Uncharacterized protein n=1 Tax=Paenibacillus donghaensis TaxID=414771 RepID=A0A2Z2KJ15_9BACL|nr:hypothetical protein [Paenibacillus donghaensis]ASA22289.1 hypothetical protein B9T62_16740 [Paenibacillus donghaensis]